MIESSISQKPEVLVDLRLMILDAWSGLLIPQKSALIKVHDIDTDEIEQVYGGKSFDDPILINSIAADLSPLYYMRAQPACYYLGSFMLFHCDSSQAWGGDQTTHMLTVLTGRKTIKEFCSVLSHKQRLCVKSLLVIMKIFCHDYWCCDELTSFNESVWL